MPGDSYEDIHWKATAKRGRPITKLYQVERTQEIYVIVDASRLSHRMAGDQPALERFITSALTLGLVAERQGDHFGLITFSNQVTRFIRASGGRAHFDACRDTLYTLKTDRVTPNYDELCAFIKLRLRRRALLLILTDLSDPLLSEQFRTSIQPLTRQHIMLVNMFRRPGVEQLFSKTPALSTDDLYMKLGGHMMWHDLRELSRSLQSRGVGMSLVENDRLSAELVSQYMMIKQRQAL